MKIRCSITVCFAAALGICLAGAFNARAAGELKERLEVQRLDNGLTVYFVRRANAPCFAAVIEVNVGSSDEGPGYAGLAHLFEHIAFKGTRSIGTRDYAKEEPLLKAIEAAGEELNAEKNKRQPDEKKMKALRERMKELQEAEAPFIIKDEFDSIYKRFGGEDLNATTGNDYTTYFIQLPNNAFELWACLESQRLLAPVLREFYLERDVVAEERRMRVDNDPMGSLYEQFLAVGFLAHPYHTPVIGWESDIHNLTMKRAQSFYQTHYTASNMAIAIVGDLDLGQAKKTIERYFGRFPKAPHSERAATREPEPLGPRRAVVRFDANPQMGMGWFKPAAPHKDDVTLEVLARIFDGGRASRLQKILVQEKQIAAGLSVWSAGPGEKYDNLFIIFASPRNPHTNAELEAAIAEQISRAREELVSTRELQRVRNQINAEAIRKLASNLGLARELAYYACLVDDPLYLDRRLEELMAVTPEEIQRVAKKYLTPERLVTVALEKAEQKADSKPDAKTEK